MPNERVVRIDADEIRKGLPEYNGKNASIFNRACTIAVDKIHDYVLDKSKNFVLDTTFTGSKHKQNVERSLKRDRKVILIYVYQKPQLAWEVTQQREKKNRRNIPKKAFIDQFFKAKENVNNIKKEFGNDVTVHLLERSIDSSDQNLEINIKSIDNYIEFDYTKSQLKSQLEENV